MELADSMAINLENHTRQLTAFMQNALPFCLIKHLLHASLQNLLDLNPEAKQKPCDLGMISITDLSIQRHGN